MKRISLLLVATLALTSCGSQKLETNDGKIVSCDAIKTKEVNVKGRKNIENLPKFVFNKSNVNSFVM